MPRKKLSAAKADELRRGALFFNPPSREALLSELQLAAALDLPLSSVLENVLRKGCRHVVIGNSRYTSWGDVCDFYDLKKDAG